MPTTETEEKGRRHDWSPADPIGLTLVGLAMGMLAERLFYARPAGVSFSIWSTLLAAVLFVWSRRESRAIDGLSGALLAVAAANSWIVAIRSEPMASFLGVSVTLGVFVIAVRALRCGQLPAWSWLDYLVAGLVVPLEGWLRPWGTLGEAQKWATRDKRGANLALALLRGLLLALPVAVIFLALLSSADPIFQELVEEAIRWLNLERILEWLGRGIYALIVAVYVIGVIVAALRRSRDESLVREGRPLLDPFLGMTEAGVVLGIVNIIFAVFVGIQFRYFFGGNVNINVQQFTYAEYARRGFGELVAVSILSLGMILLLGGVTRRGTRAGRWTFNGMSTGLVLLTGVMLVSALQRLLLYEQAYGFTRLRTYTHVSIFWIAAIYLAFLILLYRRRLRLFPGILVLAALGFSVNLAVFNVDALIVRRNLQHRRTITRLDSNYISRLSADSVPTLVRWLGAVPTKDRPDVLAGLSCHRFRLEERAEEHGWPAFRLSYGRAREALATIETELDQYVVTTEGYSYPRVQLGEDDFHYCYPVSFLY